MTESMMIDDERYLLHGESKSRSDVIAYLNNYYTTVKKAKFGHRTAHLLDMLPQTGKVDVLDYGCGWGVFTRLISEHNPDAIVQGIDIHEESLRIARTWLDSQIHQEKLPPHLSAQTQIILDNKPIDAFDDKLFDYVVSMQVIEHVHNVGNYLQGISRVLKNNGYLLITLPNIMNPLHLGRLLFSMNRLSQRVQKHSAFMIDNYFKPQNHINGWEPFHFTTLVSSMGFQVKEVRMVDGVPLPYLGKLLRRKSLIYWRTQLPGIRNLSTRMVFRLQKVHDVTISNHD